MDLLTFRPRVIEPIKKWRVVLSINQNMAELVPTKSGVPEGLYQRAQYNCLA